MSSFYEVFSSSYSEFPPLVHPALTENVLSDSLKGVFSEICDINNQLIHIEQSFWTFQSTVTVNTDTLNSNFQTIIRILCQAIPHVEPEDSNSDGDDNTIKTTTEDTGNNPLDQLND